MHINRKLIGHIYMAAFLFYLLVPLLTGLAAYLAIFHGL